MNDQPTEELHPLQTLNTPDLWHLGLQYESQPHIKKALLDCSALPQTLHMDLLAVLDLPWQPPVIPDPSTGNNAKEALTWLKEQSEQRREK